MSNNYANQEEHLPGGAAIRVLAVDTSSPAASYAITEGERVLAALSTSGGARASQTFFTNLTTLLQLADVELDQIEAFAVATGPGSFTGLRVGLAAIKGLAYTLGRPSIGINSIDAQALSVGIAGLVLVMIDAGRGEVYGGLRRISPQGLITLVEPDRVGTPSRILAEICAGKSLYNKDSDPADQDRYLAIVGDGTYRYRADLESFASSEGIDLLAASHLTQVLKSWQLKTDNNSDSAVAIGRRAAKLMKIGNRPEALAYYLRPSDAEIKRKD